jgi:hypothetical protein
MPSSIARVGTGVAKSTSSRAASCFLIEPRILSAAVAAAAAPTAIPTPVRLQLSFTADTVAADNAPAPTT